MIIRMCPYCDHEMTKKHRCDCCNSFVWKANKVDIHLNSQSRGNGEVDCAYGDDHESVHHRPAYDEHDRGQVYGAGRVPESVPTGKKGRRGLGGAARALIAIAVVLCVFGSLAGVIFSVNRSNGFSFGEEDFEDFGDDDYLDEIELSYEDISGYTQNCSAYGHLDMDGEQVVELTKAFLLEHGYFFDSVDGSFYGYKTDGASEEIAYEWCYSIDLDDNYDESVRIHYDAVTNELHWLDLCLKSTEDAVLYVQMLLQDCFGVDSVTSEELEALFSDGGSRGYCKNCEIAVYEDSYSETYIVSLQPSDSPYEYTQDAQQRELTASEVKERGQECNSWPHMDILAADAAAVVEDGLAALGYGAFTSGDTQENYAYIYSQMGGLEYEATEFYHYYAWVSADENIVIFLDADSYSDRLHGLGAGGLTLDDLEKFLELFTRIVGCGDAGALARESRQKYEEDGYAFVYFDGLELYLSDLGNDDGTVYIEVTPE